jgi:ATP-dependent RNA helicase DeaD
MTQKLTFAQLDLSQEIQKAVSSLGYEETTPIQSVAIPVVLSGKDVIGQAMTGSGKTAAFVIPMLEKIQVNSKQVQGLIMCPTRELAIQVSLEVGKIGKFFHGLHAVPVYGGQPIDRQIKALRQGASIVIGTPGRILDHISRKTINFSQVKMVVLDEADEMLNMGFRDDIEEILRKTPSERQTLLFSATMPAPILQLAKKYQRDPEIIRAAHDKVTVPSIEQFYYEVRSQEKMDVLANILDMHNPKLSIVFCNTKRKVDDVAYDLKARGYGAEAIHGDMSQQKRTRVMDRFRKGTVDILVATDVAARGIDVANIEAIFNYDVPQDEESYVHRIGRTGRAGKTGKAFSLVSGRDMYKFRDIKRYTKANIIKGDNPSMKNVEEAKGNLIIDSIKKQISEKNLDLQVQMVESMLKQDYTSLDIAAALLRMYMKKKQ